MHYKGLQMADLISWSIFQNFENDNHEFKGSMRTTVSNIDLNAFCASMVENNYFLQGGGHSNSAGFRVKIENDVEKSFKDVIRFLKEKLF